MIKSIAIDKVALDPTNPRKADVARLGLLRLSLAKLGFIPLLNLLHGTAVGAHYLLARHAIEAPHSECILWVGRMNRGGYGRVEFMGFDWLAHRLSYTTYCGVIPDSLSILHSCDNTRCINPRHLSIGTRADNVQDAASKGRMPQGSRHHNAILTEDKVRYLRASTLPHTVVARELGVHPVTVLNARNRQTWRHV